MYCRFLSTAVQCNAFILVFAMPLPTVILTNPYTYFMHVAFIPASCCAGPDWVGGGGSCTCIAACCCCIPYQLAQNAGSSLHLAS